MLALIVSFYISLLVGTQVLLPSTYAFDSTNKQTKIAYTGTANNSLAVRKPSSDLKTTAKSVLILDVKNGDVLYQKESGTQAPIASLTKVLTALVIVANHSPEEIVTIPEDLPALEPLDVKIGITAGEQFKLKDLLQALLIYSANDVANALAIWDSGSIAAFSNKMNDYSKRWGLQNSQFKNPSGLDESGHYSSASDISQLALIAHKNPFVQSVVATKSTTIANSDKKTYILTSTNKNLVYSTVYGFKTGFTLNAGQSVILYAKKGEAEILVTLLNSQDRFTESKNMVDYVFNNYSWK